MCNLKFADWMDHAWVPRGTTVSVIKLSKSESGMSRTKATSRLILITKNGLERIRRPKPVQNRHETGMVLHRHSAISVNALFVGAGTNEHLVRENRPPHH